MDKQGDPRAKEALIAVTNSNDVKERIATALLILVRRAMGKGLTEEARKIVARMPEQGTQHIRAIAERMLAPQI